MNKKNKTSAIIQARTSSTRLPNKVLLKIRNTPILTHTINQLKQCQLLDEIIVATTTNPNDQQINSLCQQLNIPCTNGNENDVLDRYLQTALLSQSQTIVRITSDCPLIDPNIVDQTVQLFHSSHADYSSNTLTRTFPRGMDTEVFSLQTLKKAHQLATTASQREHVTPYIYQHPDAFKITQLTQSQDYSGLRLTLDTREDLELITLLLQHLPPQYRLADILKLLKENPEWVLINKHVEQKAVGLSAPHPDQGARGPLEPL